MNATLPVPLDVKLMNMTATVMFLGCAAGVLAAGGAWLLRQPAFSIAHIAVEGDVAHTSAMSLRANVAPQLKGNFFTVDLEAARRAFEQVPWVQSAQVRREFPSGLRVHLQEHDVAAYWGAEGSATLVNSQGQVFEADADEVEEDGLPRLLAASPERAAEMLDMARRLAREAGEAQLKALQAGQAPAAGLSEPRTVARSGAPKIPPDALEPVYRVPAAKLPAWVGLSLSDGSYGLYQVLKATPPSAETIAKQTAQYESQLVQVASQQDFSSYLEGLKARMKITKFQPKITDKAQQ